MEKTVALISRKEGSTRDAFRDYYETRHAMLGMRHFRFRKYLRNHVVSAPPDAGFDVFSEFWQDSIATAYKTMAGPVGDLMREDERRFMDQSKQRAAKARERLVAGPMRGVDPTPTRKQILLLTRDPAADPTAFTDAAANWGSRLAEANPGRKIVRVTLDTIEPFENSSFACDAILSVWLAPGCEGISFGNPPVGTTVRTAATVEAYETPPEMLAANYKGDAG